MVAPPLALGDNPRGAGVAQDGAGSVVGRVRGPAMSRNITAQYIGIAVTLIGYVCAMPWMR